MTNYPITAIIKVQKRWRYNEMKKFDFNKIYGVEGYERKIGMAEYKVWVAEDELERANAIKAKTEKGLAKKANEVAFWQERLEERKVYLAQLLANK